MMKNYLKSFLCLCFLFAGLLSQGQQVNINTIAPNTHPLTIPQTSAGYPGTNGSNGITFVINNTNPYPVILDTVKQWFLTNATNSYNLWVSATSLSGTSTAAAPLWTNLVTNASVTTVANTQTPVFSNLNYTIPGNTRLRFHMNGNNIRYATAGAATSPDSFNNSGVALIVGDYQIGGQNVGIGGSAFSFQPRGFAGTVSLSLLSTPCFGQPNHDTVTGNMNPCPGVTTCYGLTGNNPNSGLSYQWFQSSTSATGPWTLTNLNDTNSFFCIIPPQPGPTWYMAVTTCDTSGLTDTATAIMVTPATYSPFSPCYCGNSSATSTALEDIGQFNIATLSNPTPAPVPQAGNPIATGTYSDFDTLTPIPTLIQGQSYPISVLQISSSTFMGNSYVKAWIDYDHNTAWDPNPLTEEIFGSASNAGNGYNPSGTFTVLTTALPGLARLRTVLNRTTNAALVQPCGTYTFGETEDYVVNILAAGPHDPAVTNIQAFPAGGCLDSCENVVVTLTNFGSTTLDLSTNNLVLSLNVSGPNGLTVYTDTVTTGFLQPFAANSTFFVFPCVNFHEGGCYTINSDTLTLLGSNNTNLVNDSLFAAIQVCNSRPNAVDYSLCLGDTIPTGQGLGILNCPTGLVQDSVLITFPLAFSGNAPTVPTSTAATGSAIFGTANLPSLPLGANVLNGEISVTNLGLPNPSFVHSPTNARFSLFSGTAPPAAASLNHNGLQGSAIVSLPFGSFDYLSNPPAADLNSLYTNGVPNTPTINMGNWNTSYPAPPFGVNAGVTANSGGATVATLKIVYEYVPMGVSWYEQKVGGVRISDSSLFDPLTTSNTIVNNSNTVGNYTFYGACAADTNCRVEVDLIVQGINIDSVSFTNVLCNGDSSGTAYIQGSGGNTGLYYTIGGTIIDTNLTGQFTNLPSGPYTINVHDSTGCSGTDSAFTISEPTPLVIDSILSSSPTCTPGGDGVLSVFASGGTGSMPYDSMNSNGTTTIVASNQFTNLVAGTYLITVYDSNACTDTMSQTIVAPMPPSFTNITVTDALCFGDTSGTISATAAAGTAPLATYSTAPTLNQATVGNFTGATPGVYTVTITDSLNCTADSVVNVLSPPQLGFASASVDSTNCNGDSTGSITVAGNGGVLPYSYSITAGPVTPVGNTTGSFTNLPAGMYTVQVSDSNGNCMHDTVLTILEPNVLTISPSGTSPIDCNGDTTGQIVMTSNGGTPPLTYSINPGATQGPVGAFTGLGAGSYIIVGTDTNGCMASDTVTLSQPSLLVIDSVVSTTPSCVPGGDATLTIYASGGTPPYLYSNGLIPTPAPPNVFLNQSAGNYMVEVNDANACIETAPHVISTPGAPSWNLIASTPVVCFGDMNGTITLTTNGGSGTITYTVSGPSTPASNTSGLFTNLLAGNYTLTAVDTNNCSITSTVVVATPAALSYTSAVTDSVSCKGDADGSITVVGAGGRTPYTYSLSPSVGIQVGGSFTGLPADTYVVTMLDSNGNCSLDTTLTVAEPDSLLLTATAIVNVACNGDSTGSFSLIYTGGTGIPTYTINSTVGNQVVSGTFTDLPMGTYVVTGTDGNTCTGTTTITITEPSPLVIDSIVSSTPSCVPGNDATMTVYASGGTGTLPYDSMDNGFTTIVNANVFTNLGGGNYTVTVYDANVCSVTSTHIINTPGAPSFVTTGSDSVSCNGGNDGTIAVTTTGGTGTINYTTVPILPPGVTPGTFTGAIAGTYAVTATDSNGCSVTTNIDVEEPAILSITNAGVDSVDCNGDSSGTVTLTVTGGNGGNTYSISPDPNGVVSQSSPIFGNLPDGTYTITVSDSKNCATTTSVDVFEPTAIVYTSVLDTNVSCNGANDGSIIVTSTGGIMPYSYTINPDPNLVNPQASGSFTNLNGAAYVVTLTDANNCSLDTTITILEPQPFTIDSVSTQAVACFGDSSGQIVMTSAGGTTPVSYVISPLNSSVQLPNGTFTNLIADTYTITASDANGCTSVQTYTISQPLSLLEITNISGTTPSCNPGNDGTINVTASGGTGAIRYAAPPTVPIPGTTTNPMTGFGGGTYLVTVTDDNGCTDTMTYGLFNSNAPSFTSVVSSPTVCNGDSTGNITGVASGGTGAIAYAITGPVNQGPIAPGNFVNLPAGAYSISATDANNCSVVSAISVGQAPPILFVSVTRDSVDCNGGNDGSIVVVGSGGTGMLTYAIVQPSVIAPSTLPATFSNLGAATYTVQITDSASCTMDSIIVVDEPLQLSVSSVLTNIACTGDSSGSIVMSHTGGSGVVSYVISPDPNLVNPQLGNTFGNLPADTYTITATDGNLCVTTATYQLTEPLNALEILSVSGNSPSCNPGGDGTIQVTATGGTGMILYNINGSLPYQMSDQFSSLVSGNYLMGVIDSNGCTDTMSYNLPASTSPVWVDTIVSDVLCFGDSSGSLDLVASGGTGQLTYSILSPLAWVASDTTGDFLNLPANTYTVEARDTNNCVVLANLVVGQPTPLFYTSVTSDSVSCNGLSDGSISVINVGGTTPYSYQLNGGVPQVSGTFSGLNANTYLITLSDSNGCSLDTNVIVSEPTPVVIDSAGSVDVLCNGDNTGIIYIASSGGTPSLYHVIGTDTNLSNPSVFTNYPAGMYTVSAIDANGCSVSTMVTVNEPTPLTHSITSTDVLCFGDMTGTITIVGSGGVGGYSYELYNPFQTSGTGQFTGLGAGTYTGVVIDANLCRDTTAVDTISQPTQIVFGTATTQNIDCFGASTGSIGIGATGGTGAKTLTLTGPVNQGPSASPANFQNLPAGTYTITARDANNCTVSTIVTLTQNPELFFSSITNTEETCFGDSTAVISFQGAGGVSPYTYIFDGVLPASAQTTYSGLTTGTYNIELIDALGCQVDTNYTLDGPEEINFTEFEITPTTCLDTEDGKLQVAARGGRGGRYTYSLEPGFIVNTSGLFRDLAPRTYVLRTSDTAGCFIDTTVVIPLPTNPMVVSITKDDLGCHGIGNEGRARAEVRDGTPPYTYLWSSTPAQTSSEAVGLYQGLYTVDVVDGQGCLVRDTLVIEPGPCCQEVFLPNAFSPNGDGRNDEFRVLSTAGIELEQFEVYNRWGIRVWQTSNVRSSWNGEYDGERAATGTFYYVLRYRCLTDGQTYTMKGDVVLVR